MQFDRLISNLKGREVRSLPENWRSGRECPECGVDANRPKCMWEMGGGCPRHDPNNYEPSPYMLSPDKACTEAADMLVNFRKALKALYMQGMADLNANVTFPGDYRMEVIAKAKELLEEADAFVDE